MLLPYTNTDGSFHQVTEVDFYKLNSIKLEDGPYMQSFLANIRT